MTCTFKCEMCICQCKKEMALGKHDNRKHAVSTKLRTEKNESPELDVFNFSCEKCDQLLKDFTSKQPHLKKDTSRKLLIVHLGFCSCFL